MTELAQKRRFSTYEIKSFGGAPDGDSSFCIGGVLDEM